MKVKCAIVGCGQIAGGYDTPDGDSVRTHAKAILNHPQCELVAVADIDLGRAKTFSKLWKSKRYYNHFQKLLENEKIDCLSVCSPTQFHFEHLSEAIRKHIPIVWAEKPLTNSVKETKQLSVLLKHSNTRLIVNYIRRWDVGFSKVRTKTKEIGHIQNVVVRYTKGLYHNGIHAINLLHDYFGNLTSSPNIVDTSFHNSPLLTPTFKIEFERAKDVFLLGYDNNAFYLFEMDIVGTAGRIQIIDGGNEILFFRVRKSPYDPSNRILSLQERHKDTLNYCMSEGLRRVLNNKNCPSIEEALQDQITVEEVLKAFESQ